MSVSSSRISSDKSGKKSQSQPPSSKSVRRDYSQVTPDSPNSPISTTSLRVMLQEAILPVTQELDAIKQSINDNSKKLDQIGLLSKHCANLESENGI